MRDDDRIINRYLLIGWTAINIILTISYLAEVLKGTRTAGYVVVFILITALPEIIIYLLYKKKPEDMRIKYCIELGYLVMYIFVMITGNTFMVFTYIFPMLSFLILYHKKELIAWLGIVVLAINLIYIAGAVKSGLVSVTNSRDYEIQIALILLCFCGSYAASQLYDSINRKNLEYVEKLNEDSQVMQEMMLQSITAIANTIDAKDEYTKGHSQRVAEYSYILAKALGMSEAEALDIRHTGLLHDIGKIGVPDSVLNKAGRLTDEEFAIMKTHPTVGAGILKDITMLPGLDVGAKYHHERYDGKGYPSGLKGDEIPHIAKIICVADSYDAMSSNRVYRNRLSDAEILKEFERCKGTQFDPQIAEVFIRLLREGKIKSE